MVCGGLNRVERLRVRAATPSGGCLAEVVRGAAPAAVPYGGLASLTGRHPGAVSWPLGIAVPLGEALLLRERGRHLAAAWEAGFHWPEVLPSSAAIACQLAARRRRGRALSLKPVWECWKSLSWARRREAGDRSPRRSRCRRVGPATWARQKAFEAWDFEPWDEKKPARPAPEALAKLQEDLVRTYLSPNPTAEVQDLVRAGSAGLGAECERVCGRLRLRQTDLGRVFAAGAALAAAPLRTAPKNLFPKLILDEQAPETTAACGTARWAAAPFDLAAFGVLLRAAPSPVRGLGATDFEQRRERY